MNSRRRKQMLIGPSRASQWIKPEGAGQQAIGDRGADRPSRVEGPAPGQGSPWVCFSGRGLATYRPASTGPVCVPGVSR
jgi:hypothetical protein